MYEDIPIAAIAAVADNGVIGLAGRLPWRLPKDLRRFRRLTTGHAVVMGRRTWQELGRPLPKRFNVVLSRRLLRTSGPSLADSARVSADLDDALALAAQWERGRVAREETAAAGGMAAAGGTAAAEIFLIGGAGLWQSSWQLVDRLYLTRVHADVAGDTSFSDGLLAEFELFGSEAVADALPCTWQEWRRVGWDVAGAGFKVNPEPERPRHQASRGPHR